MSEEDPQIEALVCRAAEGDQSAVQRLVFLHRNKLRRMVAVHLDPRLAARIDPSDVVQEVLVDVSRRLPDYLSERPIAFYPWLRQIAWNRLVDLHRRHISAQNRSVTREEPLEMILSDHSATELADQLIASSTNPSGNVLQEEMRRRARAALARLPKGHREILVMRHLEQLSTSEIAAVLGVAEGTVKSRHFRALERTRALLRDDL